MARCLLANSSGTPMSSQRFGSMPAGFSIAGTDTTEFRDASWSQRSPASPMVL